MWIIIAVIAAIILWIFSVQRSLVSLDEFCKNSLSQIGVQQQSRWDALTALVKLTKNYSEYEYKTMTDIIAQRKPFTAQTTAKDVDNQEDLLGRLTSRIMAVSEAYPDLKSNDMYAKTMESVNLYENQVRQSRMIFNDSVTKYNRKVRQAPDSFIAGFLGFTTMDYLKEVEGKTEMPDMNTK